MEFEVFNIFKNYTLEAILIALGAFILTYLIKLPIKKKTSNLEESKRKMINIVIMFIPLILSFIASILYFGITKNEWFSWLVFDSTISSWILALSFYAITSRIWLVIKGLNSGKLQINEDLIKENVDYLKDTIKTLTKENSNSEKNLKSVANKLNQLKQLRDLICENQSDFEFEKLSELNTQIVELEETQKKETESIQKNNETITNYKEKLYKNQ